MARQVKARLTGDDLVAIEVRARTISRMIGNAHQRTAIAYQICTQDVPDLLVEIRRLRTEAAGQGAERGELEG